MSLPRPFASCLPAGLPAGMAVAVLLGAMAAPGPALGEECRSPLPDTAPEVVFKADIGTVDWHNDKTRDQIRTLRSKSGAKVAAAGPNWQPIGLTLASLLLSVEVRVAATSLKATRRGEPVSSSGYCVRLAAATVKFGVQRLSGYVSREYQSGTCAFDIVREHEGRHVAIYQSAVKRYAPMIKKRLDATARDLRPIRAATPQEGAERLRKALNEDLTRIFEAMSRDMERQNGVLDTPAAYAAERARCPNW